MRFFCVETFCKTEYPNTLIWSAMHQDYSENFVIHELIYNSDAQPSERKAGEIIVKRLLQGDRGHYGPLEHPSITFNVGYFPHSVMQQLRTHRVGISFDVQSGRYTGDRIIRVANNELNVEEVFYTRPVGDYVDRKGKKYHYSIDQYAEAIDICYQAAQTYKKNVEEHGLAYEHARSLIPFDIRQHFFMSCNMRTLMHLLDLRHKKDAQLEIQKLSEMLMREFKIWSPQIAEWYEEKRLSKAKLSP